MAELRYHRGFPGMVWRHGVSAGMALPRVGPYRAGSGGAERRGSVGAGVLVSCTGADGERDGAGRGGLRDGWCAGQAEHSDPGRRDGRAYLFAAGNPAGYRCAERGGIAIAKGTEVVVT